jgi:hypothetical protein
VEEPALPPAARVVVPGPPPPHPTGTPPVDKPALPPTVGAADPALTPHRKPELPPFVPQVAAQPLPTGVVVPEAVVELPRGDQPWIVDNADTREILVSFAHHGNDVGIPETLSSLQRVMGDRFCERCWSKCLDFLTAAPGEYCLFTVSDVLQMYSYPHGPGVKLDHEHHPADGSSRLEEFLTVQAQMI